MSSFSEQTFFRKSEMSRFSEKVGMFDFGFDVKTLVSDGDWCQGLEFGSFRTFGILKDGGLKKFAPKTGGGCKILISTPFFKFKPTVVDHLIRASSPEKGRCVCAEPLQFSSFFW
jgi:hypothetical protein